MRATVSVFVIVVVAVSGSSVQTLSAAEAGNVVGSALSLQNTLCVLSKVLLVWPIVMLSPGGRTTKNLYVWPAVPPQPEKALERLAVEAVRGLLMAFRSVTPVVIAPKLQLRVNVP